MCKKWRVFNATDFQSLMYPCFTVCRILGIFPYKINNSIFETSKLHNIISIIVICTLFVYNLTIFYEKFNTKTTNFEVISVFLNGNSWIILTTCILIFTLVSSNSRMRLLQTIIKISSTLPSESYQKLSRLIHVKDIFGFFYVISQTFMFNYMTGFDILRIIYGIYTVLLVFTMDMLYMNCVCILKACFKEINNTLLHMQKFIVNDKSCVSMIFYYEQSNPFLIMNFKTLQKQHLMISNTVHMLNTTFSLHLLATVILTFSEIIFGMYFHVIQWYNGLSIDLDEQVDVIYLTFMIYHIIKMALLVWACETNKNQVQEIRITIHDVLNSSRDEKIKNEVVKIQFYLYIFCMTYC